ncbi:hypothetical protein PIB30_067308 [Stylosanthes scabra]|uniref:Transposase MuDR plant domain-containing protein n=1 Tax=Stylosanthes scabra TaxID=79078 RepID=A0ABU6YK44_9FABA|nr:hypothetical protein [Stylosanthes scabra]
MRVYHRGRFAMENGLMKYVDGEERVIEGLDSDRWSVYEAYYELEQLGYVDGNAISMCEIAEEHNVVELYVVHEVQEPEEIPESGYIDVGSNENGGNNEGSGGEVRLGEEGGTGRDVDCGTQANINDANDEEIGQGEQDGEDTVPAAANMGVDGTSSDEDSDDGEYVPSSDVDSVEDIHFTDSEEEFDDNSGFEDLGDNNEMPRDPKGNGVAHENLSDVDREDSDEMEADHEIGGYDEEDGDVAEGVERRRFPVFKFQKDMLNYRWQLGTLFAPRDDFKDAVATYAVQAARGVKFDKCDLRRVRAKCIAGCPFRMYAVKLREEDTWQLRSMNLRHTCTQVKRVSIITPNGSVNNLRRKLRRTQS